MQKWIPRGIALALFIALSAFTAAYLLPWQIQEGHAIRFSTEHVEGTFGQLSGTIVFDRDNLAASKLEAVVPVSSISTGIALKDKHARSKKWFDAERYPNITFTSSQIRGTVQGYESTGTLQMHGVSKPLTIPFTFDTTAGGGGVFKGNFTVNRSHYGIGKPGGKVGEEIQVQVEVPVGKK